MQAFNMTAFQCNDRGWLFPKLSDSLTYVSVTFHSLYAPLCRITHRANISVTHTLTLTIYMGLYTRQTLDIGRWTMAVFFNLFDAAEPHTSVKVTHGTPCALIREPAEYRPTGEVEVSGCLGTEAENLWGSESKAQKS